MKNKDIEAACKQTYKKLNPKTNKSGLDSLKDLSPAESPAEAPRKTPERKYT
jgi:hypothetical protein